MERRGKRVYAKSERGRREADFVKRYNPRITAPLIWRPCIPSWEKKFTSKIGNIKWEDFVENRKQIFMYNKIMDWNDSACEEAFNAAKTRFWDEYNGHKSEVLMPDPDLHIDKNIDWNSRPGQKEKDEDPMLSLSDAEEDLLKSGGMNQMQIMLPIRIEDIVPTGWDVDVPETTDLLTGLIVGDDDSENEKENTNVLRDSINIDRGLPVLRKFRQVG